MADNNDVRARIIVEGLSQAIASLKSLKGAFKDLDGAGSKMGSGAKALKSNLQKSNSTLGDVQTSMGNVKSLVLEIGAGILAWKAYAGVKDLVEYGVKYNATIETSKIGIAALIAANEEMISQDGRKLAGAEKFAAAQQRAAGITKDLQIANLQTIATLPQMIEAYQQAIGPGLAVGLSSGQVEKIVVSITKVAGSMGIDMDRLPEEIRSIMQATVTPRMSRVAEATLGAEFGSKNVNKILKQWMQAGTLFEELEKRFKAFDAAGQATQQSWNGVISNLKDVVGLVMGGGQQDFFEYLKKDLRSLMAQVATFNQETGEITINPDVLDKVKELGDDMKQLWGVLKDVGAFIFRNTEAIKDLAIAIGTAFAVTKIVQFGAALVGLLGKINDVWITVLSGESSFSGILALLISPVGILAAVVAIGAALAVWFHDSEAIQKAFAAIAGDNKTFAKDDGTRFIGPQTGQAHWQFGHMEYSGGDTNWYDKEKNIFGIGTMSTKRDNPSRPVKEVPHPKPGPAGPSDKALKDARDLAEKLANIQDEIGKSTAERIKSDMDSTMKALDGAYKEGLVSAEDYYKAKQDLENASFNAEQAALDNEVTAAGEAYQKKLDIGHMTTDQKKLAAAEWQKAEQQYYDKTDELENKRASSISENDAKLADAKKKASRDAVKGLRQVEDEQDRINKGVADWQAAMADLSAQYAQFTGDMRQNLQAQMDVIDQDTARQVDAVNRNNDITQEMADEQIAAIKRVADARKADLAVQKEEGVQGFIDGWKRAFADYVQSAQTAYQAARDAGQQFISSFQGDFSGLVQGLIQGTSSFKDFFKNLVNDMVKIWSDFVAKMVMDYLVGQDKMTGGKGGGGLLGTVIGAIINGIGGAIGGIGGGGSGAYNGGTLIQAANGAILPGSFMPFRAFATGGIAKRATLGLIGEGRYNEAVVPLPDGSTIPVSMKGKGGGDTIINFTQQLLLQPFDGPSAKAWLQTEGKDAIKSVTLDAVSNDMGFANKVRGK